MLLHATEGADRFHVVRVANDGLDEARGRVQNETLGHRSRKSNALYRTHRLLVIADERLDGSSTWPASWLLAADDG